MGQDSVSGSPNGAPVTSQLMLEFCARHNIVPQTEHLPIAKVNDAIQHLLDGKARYRIVLDIPQPQNRIMDETILNREPLHRISLR
ncbi:hypothetical protein [Hyphomicrobium sp.]|uniref:hypothetical protein n=1 Tax=Hyphomicrobium sp. TaxID=82 RepID=UPI002E33733A|nr:hypothetical protein [Hyphomicrobium sp.]HEX2841350.1 hypothetical protein [Hyphomicrobium sp.]